MSKAPGALGHTLLTDEASEVTAGIHLQASSMHWSTPHIAYAQGHLVTPLPMQTCSKTLKMAITKLFFECNSSCCKTKVDERRACSKYVIQYCRELFSWRHKPRNEVGGVPATLWYFSRSSPTFVPVVQAIVEVGTPVL